ncbi:MAG: HPF/RaiA family ribosome-associated protein, partial [Gemmataceae bacterium]|nr:HPF/RaiA family ribosome-associated protein [Gemmataceae bacterium]
MQVTVTARHGHLDDATQKQLQEKAEKLLTYFDRLTAIGVVADLHRDRADHVRVEVTAKAEHKHEFVAAEAAPDVVAAVRAQNLPLAAGQVGQPPAGGDQPYQFTIDGV